MAGPSPPESFGCASSFSAGGIGRAACRGSVEGLFWIVTTSYVVFGAINLFAMASGLGWGRTPRPAFVPPGLSAARPAICRRTDE